MAKKKADNDAVEMFWYNMDLSDERELKKAAKWIQKLCRGSLEYDLWQGRTKAGLDRCPVCLEYYGYLPAETHHYPPTMYDLCENKLSEHIFNNDIDQITGFGVCEEIMNMHMLGIVEYVVLCKSCHEKFHAGHPEVCSKVSTTFKDQKAGKQANTKKEESDNKQEEEPIPVSLPPLPPVPIIGTRDEVTATFVNSSGIEIDI